MTWTGTGSSSLRRQNEKNLRKIKGPSDQECWRYLDLQQLVRVNLRRQIIQQSILLVLHENLLLNRKFAKDTDGLFQCRSKLGV